MNILNMKYSIKKLVKGDLREYADISKTYSACKNKEKSVFKRGSGNASLRHQDYSNYIYAQKVRSELILYGAQSTAKFNWKHKINVR